MKSISAKGGVGGRVLFRPREGREKGYYYAGRSER